jgi:hypothetical protein
VKKASGVLEGWRVGALQDSITPSLHHSTTPFPLP